MPVVHFDDVYPRLKRSSEPFAQRLFALAPVTFVRDLWGRVRILAASRPAPESPEAEALEELAGILAEQLGVFGVPLKQALLFRDEMGISLAPGARSWANEVFSLVERQLNAASWATVDDAPITVPRLAFYAIKGGVGRSTAAAVAAWHLARQGKQVLVVDLDLEAPGLSTSLLPEDRRPTFGVVDWLVEDLVGQAPGLVQDMIALSPLAEGLSGGIFVAPCHGKDPGDYLEKLGRCSMLAQPGAGAGPESWSSRVRRLLGALEGYIKPDVVLIDSRAGLHDHASTVVTDLGAQVFLFGLCTEQTWCDYRILFRHWADQGAAKKIREKVRFVAAQVPETERIRSLASSRERAWGLFLEFLYDQVGVGEVGGFSYTWDDPAAPHNPPPIFWNRGFASMEGLTVLDPTLIIANFGHFLTGVDNLLAERSTHD